MEEELRKQLTSLDAQRKKLEAESSGIVSELTAKGPNDELPMGIDTDLVDREGFPRGDIDVYRARTLRGRLAVIRTDHGAIMGQIEQILVKLTALKKPSREEQERVEREKRNSPKPKPKYDPVTGKWVVANWDGTVSGVKGGAERSFDNLPSMDQTSRLADQISERVTIPNDPIVPFARINSVAPHSPAYEAGMQEGDLVVEFGPINHTNNQDLLALGAIVPEAAEKRQAIRLKILRDQDSKELLIRPRPWDGRGMLGCHIVKYHH